MKEIRFAFIAGGLGVLAVAVWLAGPAMMGALTPEIWRDAGRGLSVILAILLALCCPWLAATVGVRRSVIAALAISVNAVPCMVLLHVTTGIDLPKLAAGMAILDIAAGVLVFLTWSLTRHSAAAGIPSLVTPALQFLAFIGIFTVREAAFAFVGL